MTKNLPTYTTLETALSDRCCLTCGFCYTKGGAGNDYSKERLEKTFNWFYGQAEEGFQNIPYEKRKTHVSFYGGEPIFEWDALVYEIEKRTSQSKNLGITTFFTAVSNLALLNEEKIKWLFSHNCHISCSIDGCSEAEDYWRKYKNGKGASGEVFPAAKYLTSNKLADTVRMTTTPETVQWFAKSVKFLAEDLGFTTVNCVTADGVNWTDDALSEYAEQLKITTDWWIDRIRNGKFNFLYYLNTKMPYIWGKPRGDGKCSAGINTIYADTAGKLWPCHRFSSFVSDKRFCLGDIENGITNTEMIERIAVTDYRIIRFFDSCSKCSARFACDINCLNTISNNGGIKNSAECKIHIIQLNEAKRAHSILLSEKNPSYMEYMQRYLNRNVNAKRTPCSSSCMSFIQP